MWTWENVNMISIITPTYSREKYLHKLYGSLKRQTSKNFEWVIIDDGSLDETEQIVKNWIEEEKEFAMKYYRQENGGKHRALNRGIQKVKYDYTFIVDSDDWLLESAVERIEEWIKTIKEEERIIGVAGLRCDINGKQIGEFPKERSHIDATNIERRKCKLLGDKAEVYQTEILRKYQFPEFEGEKFLSEHVVWDAIAMDGYKLRWFNEKIYVWNILNDGLTKSGINKHINSFRGFTLSTQYVLKNEDLLRKCKAIGAYIDVAKMKQVKKKEIVNGLNIGRLMYSLGYGVYILRVIRKKLFMRG